MNLNLTDIEAQFIAQCVEGATIKGNQAIFTANLLQKLYNGITESQKEPESPKPGRPPKN